MARMKTLRKLTSTLLSAIALLLVPSLAHAGDVIVVIVNVSNPVQNLSAADLKKLFLSDQRNWESGKTVLPLLPNAGAPERTSFLKIICGMSDRDLNRYFMQAEFTGKSINPPKEVPNSITLKSIVANTPGAIGFVKALDFHGNGSDGGVKAVKVDGLNASDLGYKLRM